jgi:chromosome partitioning protein
MGSVVSVCNLKGGAGKSTIAVNLTCAIHDLTGEPCTLVDADRQGTSDSWAAGGRLPVRVLKKVLQEAKPEERYPGMLWMVQVKELADKCGVLVIDLPPGLAYSLAAVTTVSNLLLVPVNPSGVDFQSTACFIELIHKSRRLRGGDKPRCVIVPNRIDGRTTIARELCRYEVFGERVSPPIHMRTAFAKAFDTGQWIGNFAPGSAAHREIETLAELVAGGYSAAPTPVGF